MEDITPELLEKIQKHFQAQFDRSQVISGLYRKIQAGSATYAEANDFAIETGSILADAFQKNLSSDILPDGRMYYNIAKGILDPTMKNNYDLICDAAGQIQSSLNGNASIGIKTIIPDLNQDRINGIINKVSNAGKYDDVAWVLNDPVVNFSQSIVDDFAKANAEFHSGAGLSPVIVRKALGGCCKWCQQIAGTYRYPDVPKDVYRRHNNCRCTVKYDPGDGKVQNVHSKEWRDATERDKIEARKAVRIPISAETPEKRQKRLEEQAGLAAQIAGHPKMLGAYTPKGLKQSLERAGYDVKPLGKGSLKGVPFEEGGGFRITYDGDKYLQYHPESSSHHGGAYYKTASGKDGIKRYNLEGELLDGNSEK